MNRNASFVRKAVFISIIVVLLIPLAMIARPATRRPSGNRIDTGGILATDRINYDLSQAKLGEVDPASETMKLVSLGFRSIAATSLWLNSIDANEKKDWDRFAASLNTLIKIQPNFAKVWEYQAHNMSYNTSVEFDDFEQRYHWVKKGLELLTEGLGYNRLNHRFTDNLGWFTGHKIGMADEKLEYRRLFRKDEAYHASLDRYFDQASYKDPDYGMDNWLLAYQWYNRSKDMVERGIDGQKAKLQISELMFYMHCPTQLRLHVTSLEEEFPPEESFKFKWRRAGDEWEKFGKRTIHTTFNLPLTLEGMLDTEIQLATARAKLDKLAPGFRESELKDIYETIGLSDDKQKLLLTSPDVLSDEDQLQAREIRFQVEELSRNIDKRVLEHVPPEHKDEAINLLRTIADALLRLQSTDKYRSTANYQFWKLRNEIEATDEALAAHQKTFQAEEKGRRSIYADYAPLDSKTLQPQRDDQGTLQTETGAINDYLASFRFWDGEAKKTPTLVDAAFFDTIFEDAGEVSKMYKELGRPWPHDFPMQEIIDQHAGQAERWNLVLSRDIDKDKNAIPELPSIEF